MSCIVGRRFVYGIPEEILPLEGLPDDPALKSELQFDANDYARAVVWATDTWALEYRVEAPFGEKVWRAAQEPVGIRRIRTVDGRTVHIRWDVRVWTRR